MKPSELDQHLAPIVGLKTELAGHLKRKQERQTTLESLDAEVARQEREVDPDDTDAVHRLVAARNSRDIRRGQLPKADGDIARVRSTIKERVGRFQVDVCARLDNDLLLEEAEQFRKHIEPYIQDEGLRNQIVNTALRSLPYLTKAPVWRAFATTMVAKDSLAENDADFAIRAVEELRAYLKVKR